MAAPLSRTWYNGLVDDTGDGISGTVWNKAQVNGLLNTVDASLVTVVDKAGNPAATNVAIFSDGDTVTGSPSASMDVSQAHLLLTGGYPGVTMVDPGATAGDQSIRIVNYGNGFFIIGKDTLLSLSRTGLLTAVGGVSMLAGGLTFPTTPTPSPNTTTLDEYREYPWTPSVAGGGGGSGVAYGYRDGYYTKVGRCVTAHGRLSFTNIGTLVGPGFYVADLPYPCGVLPGVVMFSGCDSLSLTFSFITGSVLPNQAVAQLRYVASGGGVGIQLLPHTALTANSYFEFTIIYQANQ